MSVEEVKQGSELKEDVQKENLSNNENINEDQNNVDNESNGHERKVKEVCPMSNEEILPLVPSDAVKCESFITNRRETTEIPNYSSPPYASRMENYDDVILNRSKTTQAVIESLRNNKVVEENLYKDKLYDGANTRLLPVDWLGLPLSASTLPDFVSTTKLHYKRPTSSTYAHQQRSVPTLRSVDDPSKTGQSFHDQFLGVAWVPADLSSERVAGGYSKKDGQIAELLPHPKTSIWNIPESLVERIRKNDPMEYLNLLDPNNVISTEKGIYQWLIRDQGEIGLQVTVGESVKSSGFCNNRIPYLPLREDRDFRSVYKKSFCDRPPKNDIEGLLYSEHQELKYPGYGGGATMRDFPSSFVRFGPNVLKTKPEFAKRNYRRAMSAKPVL